MASALERMFSTSRLPMRGRARVIRDGAVEQKAVKKAVRPSEEEGVKKQKQKTEKKQAVSSPIRCPMTASSTVISRPLSTRISAMRNTAAMRTICSMIWAMAGIFVF